jgi:hypothetical protein
VSNTLETGLIALAGVALGLVGTAWLEQVRRTASRRDAAHERQAALLRELQEALEDFNREWTDLIMDIAQGKAHLATVAVDSKPALALSRYRVLSRRVIDDRLRQDVESISELAVNFAIAQYMGDISGPVAMVQDRLGAALRREL